MEELQSIKDIVSLVSRMQNLCERFDETNKTAIITAKVKILLELSKSPKLSPNALKQQVCLAKSNLALLCNSLIKEGLMEKSRDEFDSRSIYYNITDKGSELLNNVLKQMKKNFEGEIAYKNNMKQVDLAVKNLLSLVN